jgi:internalin A
LSGLTNLTLLALDSNNFNDSELSILNSLTSLTSLSLYGNNISDISDATWSGLTGLTHLNFISNNLNNEQLAHMSGLVNLTWLGLNNNNISDLASIGSGNATLVGFASGNSINISNNTGLNGPNSIAALAEVATLQSNGATVTHNIDSNIHDEFTDVNFQQCVDIAVSGDDDTIDATLAAALSGTLTCNSLGILNISGAQYLTSITDLFLTNNSISDLTPISTLSNLTHLYVNSLTNLSSLSLYGNNISDISGVTWSGLTSLTSLNLNSNDLDSVDLTNISGLTTLNYLGLNYNNITTLNDLSGLTNLTSLVLNNNSITDLSPIGSGNAQLAGFASGNTITLNGNPLCGGQLAEVTLLQANGATVNHDIDVCGSGTLNEACGEQCDDGGTVSGDGCSATCQGEYYGCYATFATPPTTITNTVCNNQGGALGYSGGWSPDSSSCVLFDSNTASCDTACTTINGAYPTAGLTCGFINCGNGSVEPDGTWPTREQCDDGNTNSGDGCSVACMLEGRGGQIPPPCSPFPVELDIEQTSVSQAGGTVAVTLKWSESGFENDSMEGTLKVSRKIFSGGTYLPDKTVEISPTLKSWTDTDIPESETQKKYKYQLVTQSCDQSKYGNEVEVIIDPIVPAGTGVDVALNFKIKVKEAYDILLMDRFRELFTEERNGIPAYIRSCEEVEVELFENINSGIALEYIITCFGEDDESLSREILAKRNTIIPPLVAMFKGLNGELTEQTVANYIQSKIAEIREQLSLKASVKSYVASEALRVGGFVNETSATDLSEADETVMQQIDEQYFTGFSHAADLVIEKYDGEENLLETFETHTNIFGKAIMNAGEFIAGDDYIIKIKLVDEKFVLPKVITLQINNAAQVNGNYTVDIDLIFDRHFRYGDFNEDGVIDINDIGAWGNLLRGEFEDGYELWELWQFANLDGVEGINLLDILTLQENWGGLGD